MVAVPLNDIYELFRMPEKVDAQHENTLKMWVDRYPYFYQARLLWLKILRMRNDPQTTAQVSVTSIYTHDHRWLYFYLYPEMKPSSGSGLRTSRFSGSYFDLLHAVETEGGDTRISLSRIANQLKESRANQLKQTPPQPPVASRPVVDVPVPDYFKVESSSKGIQLEEKYKMLIHEKKYREALEIMKQLYFINPKKSVYFADQIRFLEKIIINTT